MSTIQSFTLSLSLVRFGVLVGVNLMENENILLSLNVIMINKPIFISFICHNLIPVSVINPLLVPSASFYVVSLCDFFKVVILTSYSLSFLIAGSLESAN